MRIRKFQLVRLSNRFRRTFCLKVLNGPNYEEKIAEITEIGEQPRDDLVHICNKIAELCSKYALAF